MPTPRLLTSLALTVVTALVASGIAPADRLTSKLQDRQVKALEAE